MGLLHWQQWLWDILFTSFTLLSQNKLYKKLGNAMATLIALIDRVRVLDNDIIRLRSKLNTVLELREQEEKKKTKDE
jgi:hypothetical protein